MEKQNVNETAVLKFLESCESPVNRSVIGCKVGKRPPKQAAAWAGPILVTLVEQGLVKKIEDGGKTLFSLIKKTSKSDKVETKSSVLEAVDVKKSKKVIEKAKVIEEKPIKKEVKGKKKPKGKEIKPYVPINRAKGIDEDTTEVPETSPAPKEKSKGKVKEIKPTKEKTVKEKEEKVDAEFNFKKAKREIMIIVEDKINNMTVHDTKGKCIAKAVDEWQKKNCEIPEEYFQRVVRPVKRKYDPIDKSEKGLPRTNLLSNLDKKDIETRFNSVWLKIQKDKEIDESSKKREFAKQVKEYIAERVSEQSMRANMIKSFISTLVNEITTGEEREYKDDGRPLEKGQHVEYTDKKGNIKTGVITRVYMCNIYFQRTIIVREDGQTKTEMKIDRKINKVID